MYPQGQKSTELWWGSEQVEWSRGACGERWEAETLIAISSNRRRVGGRKGGAIKSGKASFIHIVFLKGESSQLRDWYFTLILEEFDPDFQSVSLNPRIPLKFGGKYRIVSTGIWW
jgi:hypothetical protein